MNLSDMAPWKVLAGRPLMRFDDSDLVRQRTRAGASVHVIRGERIREKDETECDRVSVNMYSYR